jgi:hypothetical protein
METKKSYKPGEICPESGLYRLKGQKHVSDKQALIPLTKGEKFPPCRTHEGPIEWELERKAERK